MKILGKNYSLAKELSIAMAIGGDIIKN